MNPLFLPDNNALSPALSSAIGNPFSSHSMNPQLLPNLPVDGSIHTTYGGVTVSSANLEGLSDNSGELVSTSYYSEDPNNDVFAAVMVGDPHRDSTSSLYANNPEPTGGGIVGEYGSSDLKDISSGPYPGYVPANWSHFGSTTIANPLEGQDGISFDDLMGDSYGDVPRSVRCAWKPSERTCGALQAIASAVPAGDFLGSDQLTKPGVLSEKLFVNPAFELALRVVGTIPPSCIPENPDEMLNRNDLRGLLEKGFYSSAANLAGKILRSYGQGFGSVGSLTKHSPDSLLLWYYRIAALVHYGEVELASKELEAFVDLDNPDLYFEYYNEPTAEPCYGSMVPFELRLLYARIPQLLSPSAVKTTMDRLYALREKTECLLSQSSQGNLPSGVDENMVAHFQDFWQQRRITVIHHIVSAAVLSEDFDTSISLISSLIELAPQKATKLWHCLGLLYCHVGTPKMARVCFETHEKLLAPGSPELEYAQLLHTSLIAMVEETVVKSLEVNVKMYNAYPQNPSTANAVAIGYFYSGRMSDAINFLENLVIGQPKRFLTVQGIRNLVAMYELQNIQVRPRKLRLLSLICQYMPDGHGVDSLKYSDI